MATACAVKLSNTTVEKATITVTDTHQIVNALHSTIRELDATMLFAALDSTTINNAVMTLDASEINVNMVDLEESTGFGEEFVYSFNHSKCFFTEILTQGGITVGSSPGWTIDTDESPTYGNKMSYNVKPFVYESFSALQFQFWSGDGDELTVGVILTSMGSATTIRATAEWQDRNAPGWNLMVIDGGSDTFADITGLVGEYEAVFKDTLPGCGNYDIKVTLVDNDEPRTTIQLEENPNSLQCA